MKQITLRLPGDVAQLVEQRSMELSTSQNSVIVDTLRTGLTAAPPPDNMGVQITKSQNVRNTDAAFAMMEQVYTLAEQWKGYAISLEERLRIFAAFYADTLPISLQKMIPEQPVVSRPEAKAAHEPAKVTRKLTIGKIEA